MGAGMDKMKWFVLDRQNKAVGLGAESVQGWDVSYILTCQSLYCSVFVLVHNFINPLSS